MSLPEYDLVRLLRPELHLPIWENLSEIIRDRIFELTPKAMIIERSAYLLGFDYEQQDDWDVWFENYPPVIRRT